MKRFFLFGIGVLLFAGVSNAQTSGGDNDFTPLPKPAPGEKVATFGGGCFWSMSEAMLELKGVNKVCRRNNQKSDLRPGGFENYRACRMLDGLL